MTARPTAALSASAQVAALETMDRDALLALWSATLGGEPPPRLSQPLLRRMLAWELQAREQGGLSAAAVRELERLAAARGREAGRTGEAGSARCSPTPRLKAGGRLLREWGGVTHVVDVVEGGFLWRGERHRSLSAIARAITGAHWSGPRFFGLKESASAPGAKMRSAPGAERKGSAGTLGATVDATISPGAPRSSRRAA